MSARLSMILGCVLVGQVACADARLEPDASTDGEHEHHHSVAGHGGAHDDIVAAQDDDFKGCPDGMPSVAPGLRASGERFAVSVLASTPSQLERHRNDWTVELSSLDGSPAPDAEIARGQTFMPLHAHDGGVQPRMTQLSEPGQIQVDRLNFIMRGPWEVRFWVRSGSLEEDYVVFEVCVAK
jgi:hypothetical protein